MNEDTQTQLERAKELLHELETAYSKELEAKNVSGKTKNLAQEVLLKIRHLLDQSIYKFFEKNYLPSLSEKDKKSARVYFPIVPKKEDLKSALGRAKMNDLETTHNDLYVFLDSVQPYNQNYLWLKYLADYSAEKHIRLTPQIKEEEKKTTVSRQGGSVSWGSGVSFGNGVSLLGVPINPITQVPIPNNIVETKIEKWVSFLFDGSNINALWLCKKSVADGEMIIKKLEEF